MRAHQKTEHHSRKFFSQKLEEKPSIVKAFIIESTLFHEDSEIQFRHVMREFNKNVIPNENAFTTGFFWGENLKPGQFIIGACNKRPELASFDPALYTRRTLYGDPAINSEVVQIVNQTDLFYGAYGSWVLNVPVNKYALAWSGNIPRIFGPGPHVIHDPNFIFKNELVDQTDIHIKHGSLHIVRVPAGKIAKIFLGTIPHLLESKEEPYIFDSGLFKMVNNEHDKMHGCLYDATERLIEHGSIKRVMPLTGEVAVTYNQGNLEIIKPDAERGPEYIRSDSHIVRGFLNTNDQQHVFPSDVEKARRQQQYKNLSDKEMNNIVFMTKDSLKVGVKIMVAFRIHDPEAALKKVGPDNILSTIENLAAVDMGKVVSRLSSQEFLNPYSHGENKEDHKPGFWQEIWETLSKELNGYGITLLRFNIETPVYLDDEMAKEMAKSAAMTAQTYAKTGIIKGEALVEQSEAERKAKKKSIELEQENQAMVLTAESKLQAAKTEAEAMRVHAQGEADAAAIRATAEVNALKLRGELYEKYPALLELKKVEAMAGAINKAPLIYPLFPMQNAVRDMDPSCFSSPQTLFGGTGKKAVEQPLELQQKYVPLS